MSKRLEQLRERRRKTFDKLAKVDAEISEELAKIAARRKKQEKAEARREARQRVLAERKIMRENARLRAERAAEERRRKERKAKRRAKRQAAARRREEQAMAARAERKKVVEIAEVVAEEFSIASGTEVTAQAICGVGSMPAVRSARKTLIHAVQSLAGGVRVKVIASVVSLKSGSVYDARRKKLSPREDMVLRNTIRRMS